MRYWYIVRLLDRYQVPNAFMYGECQQKDLNLKQEFNI